jgi:hypothetical protein
MAYPGICGSADLSKTNQASKGCEAANPVLTIGWYSTVTEGASARAAANIMR